MAKLDPARLDGVYGMRKFTAEELYAFADELEARIESPTNTDDPKWLRRWINRVRRLAGEKEKAVEHKESQK